MNESKVYSNEKERGLRKNMAGALFVIVAGLISFSSAKTELTGMLATILSTFGVLWLTFSYTSLIIMVLTPRRRRLMSLLILVPTIALYFLLVG